jgi:hypothetical protein
MGAHERESSTEGVGRIRITGASLVEQECETIVVNDTAGTTVIGSFVVDFIEES